MSLVRSGQRPRPSHDHEEVWARLARDGARGWDDFLGGGDRGSYRAVEAFLESTVAPPAGCRVLDLGCGGGQVLKRLVARGYRAMGFDYATSAVEIARLNLRRWGIVAELAVGDAVQLDFVEDASFDLVVDNHVLHCVVDEPDRARMLSRIASVLRPGGVFFTETMSREGAFDPHFCNANPVTGIATNRSRIWTSAAALDSALEHAGLGITHRGSSAPLPGEGAVGDLLVRWCRRKSGVEPRLSTLPRPPSKPCSSTSSASDQSRASADEVR